VLRRTSASAEWGLTLPLWDFYCVANEIPSLRGGDRMSGVVDAPWWVEDAPWRVEDAP